MQAAAHEDTRQDIARRCDALAGRAADCNREIDLCHEDSFFYFTEVKFPAGTLSRILFISAAENARRVCVRMLPSEPMLAAKAITASSPGDSAINTASNLPIVQ